jgi:glycosyltransferase involved in cell wall biosynthesis
MTTPRPFCSIVVPTRNRPSALRICLESLARLDYPRKRMEVLVVDDGGVADLESVLGSIRPVLNVRLLRQEWAGPAAARNLGAESARGELLAFTDDDCAPRPEWLGRLAEHYMAQPTSATGGLTINALTSNPYSKVAQMIIDAGYAQCNCDSSALPFFTTNNLAVPADGFRHAGGFDVSFTTAEDREFCARWTGEGRQIVYEPNALVDHAHDLTFWSFCRLYFTYGRGAFQFHRKQATRGRPVRIEPSFYLRTLPRHAFAGRNLVEGSFLCALLFPWHLANTMGFLCEWVLETCRGTSRSRFEQQMHGRGPSR